MMTIEIEPAKLEDLNISNFSQRPYNAFMSFWQGTENEFYEYMKKHNLDYAFTFANVAELNEKADFFLNQLSEAVRRDIGKFDFRISTALTGRNIKMLETEDYVKVTLYNDEVNNKEIYDTFLSFNSRSFADFRTYDEAKNTLTFIYNRRGIFDENERIAIVKSKNSATMQDSFKSAKDNNFVLSGLCYELAKENGVDFKFEYVGANNEVREIITTADDILNTADKKEEVKQKAIKEKIIRQEAREEIVKESAEKRQSLSEDSTSQEIVKEGNTEIRIDIPKNLDAKNLDKVINESIEKYIKKEQEKLRIRLDKAEREAKVVYRDMQEKIANDGMSIFEALNYAKQKYREDHVVNMASTFLTKDILEVMVLKNEIDDKEKEITALNGKIEAKNDEITKREETISSLKSTVQNKNIEISNLGTKHEEEKKILIAESKKKFNELDNIYKNEIQHYKNELTEKDNELNSQDELIARLNSQNELFGKQLDKLNSKYEQIIRDNQSFLNSINALNEALKEQQAQNNALNEALKEQQAQNNALNEALKEQQAQNNALNEALKEKTEQKQTETNEPENNVIAPKRKSLIDESIFATDGTIDKMREESNTNIEKEGNIHRQK
ncbi:hypothetical protein KDE13_09070 [Campylobacter sp. faydin G-140]|uniref:hypothetical protein n=1 Tax=Campylobacter anatolicus TaxID=2829105 RepID=UPI001B999F26|nr:hypothetical protein [Campylobacter anatolicus]MBR8466484.1 hypothetical protein [Campylobacter anatolicus]